MNTRTRNWYVQAVAISIHANELTGATIDATNEQGWNIPAYSGRRTMHISLTKDELEKAKQLSANPYI